MLPLLAQAYHMHSISPPDIEIRAVEAIGGLGVFAARDFAAGELIELAPVIVLSASTFPALDTTELFNYYFSWKDGAAIGLGYSSVYNHSFKNNAEYHPETTGRYLRMIARTHIKKGDEIRVDYTRGDPATKLWFEPVEW